jgi:lipopolysaccharide transport system ATP-binding protein
MKPAVTFDHVWKRFRRGERHDSLRDLVPSIVRRVARRRPDRQDDKDFWALQDVSFEVAPGEAFGIIGPNGAGKSTTLKLLTRIIKPTRGECAVHGRTGALIEVAAGFHPDLTGRENVFLQGAIMGMKRAEVAHQFDQIVDFSGVGPFIDTPVKRYSSGMNARLGFSIAAHLNPDVLIIDEVLAVGDTVFQQRCFQRMQEFVRQGAAVVFVSHNLAAVSQLCHRALLLSAGRVEIMDSAELTIATYCTSHQEDNVAKQRSQLNVTVRKPDAPPSGMWIVAPGTRIRLVVDIECEEDLPDTTLGVVVRDIGRGLYVYGASSDALGIPTFRGVRGDTARFGFEFAANLARGTYSVEVNVFDPARQHHVAIIKSAAQFTVAEHVTYDGVANLFLTGARTDVRECV